MPEKHKDPDIAEIARQIKDYLAAHPNAADSVEGVTRWWVARTSYERSVKHVQQALDYLLDAGLIEKWQSSGGSVVYSDRRNQQE